MKQRLFVFSSDSGKGGAAAKETSPISAGDSQEKSRSASRHEAADISEVDAAASAEDRDFTPPPSYSCIRGAGLPNAHCRGRDRLHSTAYL